MKAAKAVKKVRLNMFLSVQQFATMLNVTPQTIRNYERELRDPKINIIERIVEIAKKNKIGITVNDFFD
jgi:predicted transcriptional regulator